MKIASPINDYPKVSHRFLGRQIQALQRQGPAVKRTALRVWDQPPRRPPRGRLPNPPRLRVCAIERVHAHFGANSPQAALPVHAHGGAPHSFTVHGPAEFMRPAGLMAKIRKATPLIYV